MGRQQPLTYSPAHPLTYYSLLPTLRLPFYARFALMLLSLGIILFLLEAGQVVFVPLVFSLLTAFFLYPLCKWLEQRARMSCGLAAFVSVLGFLLLISGFAYFLSFQIIGFAQDVPQLQSRVNEWTLAVQQWIAREYGIDSTTQTEYAGDVADGILQSAAASAGLVFFGAAGFVFWTLIVFVYTFFMLYHRRLLVRALLQMFPVQHREEVRETVVETRVVTNGYVKGLLIEALVVSGALAIAFSILGIRYALLLALVSAVVNVIPYLGIFISMGLVAVVTLTNHSPATALWAVGIRYVIHFLDANLLVPRVIGGKVRINALVTLLGVLAGGALWGVAGTFLAIPLTAALKIIFSHIPAMQPWALMMDVDDSTGNAAAQSSSTDKP